MPNSYIALPLQDRREALAFASAESGRPVHLLEKDIWVVWTLNVLFTAPFGGHLEFKGGTSLSKAFGIIQRFSEDIDITYDIRAIAPELAGDTSDALPSTKSQARKWRDVIETALPKWNSDVVLPCVAEQLGRDGLTATLRAEGDCLYIDYKPLETGTGYVAPSVRVEFGAKSTGEPAEVGEVTCDAVPYLSDLTFLTATPRVLMAERTFWEKATAAHAYCLNGVIRGRGAYARHWHDLTKLADAGIAESAIQDRNLAEMVAHHKTLFFPENTEDGPIDYYAAVHGAILLAPEGDRFEKLEADYSAMVADGLLPDLAEPFIDMIAKCQITQNQLDVRL